MLTQLAAFSAGTRNKEFSGRGSGALAVTVVEKGADFRRV